MKSKTNNHGTHSPTASRGNSLVELALILPILMTLALGAIDFGRAIHFNNILISITREGANLASRTSETTQYIITALEKTAEPLLMQKDGMVYITQLTLQDDGSVLVVQQTRAPLGNTTYQSKVWSGCKKWASDACTSLPSPPYSTQLPTPLLQTLPPKGGSETFYAVEAFYDYSPFTSYVMPTAQDLYSLTVL